jgi:hypothetical protein
VKRSPPPDHQSAGKRPAVISASTRHGEFGHAREPELCAPGGAAGRGGNGSRRHLRTSTREPTGRSRWRGYRFRRGTGSSRRLRPRTVLAAAMVQAS